MPQESSSPTSPDPDAHADKRRKLRKGTRSCWECKRRKVKCTFALQSDQVCIPCRRRNAKCISQALPDDAELEPLDFAGSNTTSLAKDDVLAERMEKLESLVERLSGVKAINSLEQVPLNNDDIAHLPTPTCTDESTPGVVPFEIDFRSQNFAIIAERNAIVLSTDEKHKRWSGRLLEAFPSEEDSRLICNAIGAATDLYFQMNTTPRHQLDKVGGASINAGWECPHPNMHPVILAKRMLTVALCIQHLYNCLPELSEPPIRIMQRMVSAAINIVTTNEELLGSVEALECIILEGEVKSAYGNLRQSWLAMRRAMSAAQLMGIHRRKIPQLKYLDPGSRIDPRFTWFRLQYMDRMLCLLLGLPQYGAGADLPPDIAQTHTGRFERTHAIVAGRLLERNEQNPDEDDYALIESIDKQLLDAATELPPNFWLPVNFGNMVKGSSEAFWEAMRFVDQLHHFLLLVHLHLPCLYTRSTSTLKDRGPNERQLLYSKLACTNAAREILTRHAAFRSFSQLTSCCRSVDFIALVAAMALLLAHCDSHRTQDGSLLRHQRVGDRAMMYQVLENMDSLVKLSGDPMTSESTGLLRRLLDIEEKAANHPSNAATCNGGLELKVPYLGNVVVTPKGIYRMGGTEGVSRSDVELPPSGVSGPHSGSVHVANFEFINEVRRPMPPPAASPADGFTQQDTTVLDPGLVAGMSDWAFQGVDTAFFDSLMRGSSLPFDETGNTAIWDIP